MERESERKAAWAAVRCAASVGQAHHTLSLLIGHSAVTSGKVGPNADPPEFASLDLVGSYVIGERKQIFKSRSTGISIMFLFHIVILLSLLFT